MHEYTHTHKYIYLYGMQESVRCVYLGVREWAEH